MTCCIATIVLAAAFGQISVTNHAGRVLSGELRGADATTFTVGERRLPLSVLPAAERRRVLAQAGCDVRTAQERRIDADLDYELRRIDARLSEGEIDGEAAARLRADARANAAYRRTAADGDVRKRAPRKTGRR